MEQKQEKLYALLNEKLDHTEEISDEEILVEIDKLIWEEAKGQYCLTGSADLIFCRNFWKMRV